MTRLHLVYLVVVVGVSSASVGGFAPQVREIAIAPERIPEVQIAAPAAGRAGGTPLDQPRAQQIPVGTAQISGTVTRVDSGRPVRGAMVRLSGSSDVPFARGRGAGTGGGRGDGSGRGFAATGQLASPLQGGPAGSLGTAVTGLPLNRTAVTDAQGAFLFDRLPSGRFTVNVTRNQYLATNYGERAPGRSGKTIVLRDGQRLSLAIPIMRTGVITGVILGEDGDPLPSASVRAMQSVMNLGVKRLQTTNIVTADDRGVYRLSGLSPGDFIVYAVPSANDVMQADRTSAERAAFEAAYAAAASNARGGAPLSTVLVNLPALQTGPMSISTYAPTYFPGTPMFSGASLVTLGAGEERLGVDFQVQTVRAADIRGSVNIGAGFPAAVRVSLSYRDPSALGPPLPTAGVNPDGTFLLRGVAPGEYVVFAQTTAQTQSVSQVVNGQTVFRTQQGPENYPRLWARSLVTVDGLSTPEVSLQLQAGRTISGHLVFEMARPPDLNTARMTVTATLSATSEPRLVTGQGPTAQVMPDGRFVLEGVTPGSYTLRSGLLKSAIVNGIDTLDFPLEFTGEQDVTGAVLTMTDKVTELSGKLTENSGEPGYDYTIIVVADESRYWVPGSRRITTARPGAGGQFAFRNLPPGGYFLAAVTDLEPGSQYDPAFLKELAGAAMRVTVTEGGRHVQDVRVAR